MVGTFIAILCYFSVSFCVEILRFYCRNVSNISWDMRINGVIDGLLLFLTFVAWHITHITDDWILFGASFDHELSYIIALLYF